MKLKKIEFATKTPEKTIRTLLRLPLIIVAQKRPTRALKNIIQGGDIFAVTKKSLKSIAKYCFKRTATQKIGSENSKKAKNVIP